MRRLATAALLALASCRAGFGAGSGATAAPPPAERPREIALNDGLLCVRDGGRVRCGVLSDPDGPIAVAPALGGVDAVDLALGTDFGCVVARGGGVLCFGDNSSGELGARSRAKQSNDPLPVAGLTGVRRVFAGPRHACAIAEDARVYCWGANDSGQVGSPVRYEPEARELVAPFEVEGARGAVTLALGRTLSCALDATNTMACWGTPPGAGSLPPDERALAAPTPLGGFPRGFDDLVAGEYGYCGLRRGDLFCWGDGMSMFGEDDVARPPRPHAQGLSGVRRAALDTNHACALHDGGRVSCWSRGLTGGGGRPYEVTTLRPRPVEGLPPAVDVAINGERACALTAAGEIYCWGAWPWVKTPADRRPRRVRGFD